MGEKNGDPVILSTSGNYLAVGTDQGFVRVYDLNRRCVRLVLKFCTQTTCKWILYLAWVFTLFSFVYFDYYSRDARPHCTAFCVPEAVADFGEILKLKCNSNGSKVAIIISKVGL